MQVEIKGKNVIDKEDRIAAIKVLNSLDTSELIFLKELVETPNALKKLIAKAPFLKKWL